MNANFFVSTLKFYKNPSNFPIFNPQNFITSQTFIHSNLYINWNKWWRKKFGWQNLRSPHLQRLISMSISLVGTQYLWKNMIIVKGAENHVRSWWKLSNFLYMCMHITNFMGHDLAIIIVQNLFFIGLYGINMDVIHLFVLNIDVMYII